MLTFIIMVAVARLPAAGHHGARLVSAVEGRAGIAPVAPIGSQLDVRYLDRRARSCSSIRLLATPFFTFQVGAYALILGTIALSLTVLAGYGGMVSLAQMSVAGLAGYMVAILGHNSLGLGLDWPWWIVLPAAIVIAVLFAVAVGLLAIRTAGIYTIMITLAIGMVLYLFAQQNYAIFNGHSGFAGIAPPQLFGVELAGSGPLLLSLACDRRRLLRGRALHLPRAVRPGAAGDPRQSAPHGRRSASTSRPIASQPMPRPASSPRLAASSWSGSTAASRRAPSASTG